MTSVAWACRLACLGLALSGASPSAAQPLPVPPPRTAAPPSPAPAGGDTAAPAVAPAPLLPIAAARRDGNGDGLPDRLGQRVRVSGRVAQWIARAHGRESGAVQAGGVGILLNGVRTGVPPAAGDSVVVTGLVGHNDGQTYLDFEAVERIPGAPVVPAPVPIRPGVALEAYEGVRVVLDGTALLRGTVRVGSTLAVSFGDGLLYALSFDDTAGERLARVEVGQPVRVTGVLGQFDRDAPYLDGYQIYPATADDVSPRGLSPVAWRRLVALSFALLALALVSLLVERRRSRHRAAARALSDRRYRTLFERSTSPVLFCELAPDGPRLLDMNLEASRTLKYARETYIGRPLWEIGHDPDAVRALYEGLLAHGSVSGRYAGKLATYHVEGQLLREGDTTYAVIVLRDVTREEAAAAELVRAREEAEAYARLQATFVANMSHEIRTPLAGIIGFAEILREELDGPHRNFAEIVEAGARRLLGTLNTVLEFARLDAGTEHAPRTPGDLTGTVWEALKLLYPLADERGVALTSALAPSLEGYVNADALERIVYNLVGNAVRFTPRGGRVSVTLDLVDADRARLVVSDTGVGMDDDFLGRLYTPFTQASTGSTREHEGAGLGLSITQRLVTLLGGTIDVVSAPGEGTTFSVLLPIGPSLPAPSTLREPAAPPELADTPPRPMSPTSDAEGAPGGSTARSESEPAATMPSAP